MQLKGINITMDETAYKKIDMEYNMELIDQFKKLKDKEEITKMKEEVKVWAFDTDGTNILHVLNSPYVDIINTYSNDIHEMNKTFGIEAARELLIEQMEDLFEEYINIRHIGLLCDITPNSVLTPINRQGIKVGDTGLLVNVHLRTQLIN